MRGKDPNKASPRRIGRRGTGTPARRDRGRCRRSAPGRTRPLPRREATSDRWTSRPIRPKSTGLSPILDAAEDLSVFVDGRNRVGGAGRRWGGRPM